jgi:hypothetical protein
LAHAQALLAARAHLASSVDQLDVERIIGFAFARDGIPDRVERRGLETNVAIPATFPPARLFGGSPTTPGSLVVKP